MSLNVKTRAAYERRVAEGQLSQEALDRGWAEYERIRARGWRARRAMWLVRRTGKWMDDCYTTDMLRERIGGAPWKMELWLLMRGWTHGYDIGWALRLDRDAAAYQMVEEGWWG